MIKKLRKRKTFLKAISLGNGEINIRCAGANADIDCVLIQIAGKRVTSWAEEEGLELENAIDMFMSEFSERVRDVVKQGEFND